MKILLMLFLSFSFLTYCGDSDDDSETKSDSSTEVSTKKLDEKKRSGQKAELEIEEHMALVQQELVECNADYYGEEYFDEDFEILFVCFEDSGEWEAVEY